MVSVIIKLTFQSHPDLFFSVRSLCTLNAVWPALDFLAVLAKPVYAAIVVMF